MAKVIVDILILDADDFEKQSRASGEKLEPMTPREIVNKIVQLDPDDAQDVQLGLYDALWGEKGIIFLTQQDAEDSGCVCAETSIRNCPVHANQEVEVINLDTSDEG